MKASKYIYLLIAALCIPLYAFCQSTKTVNLAFEENEFEISTEGDVCFIGSYKYMPTYKLDTNLPALPYISVNVLVNCGTVFEGVTWESTDSLIHTGAEIAPNMLEIPTNVSMQYPMIPPHPSYLPAIYPLAGEVEYTGTHTMDGYQYLSFLVCPFKYDADNQSLYLNRNITLNIQMNTDSTSISSGGKNMRNVIKDLVINKNELDSLYPNNSRMQMRTYQDLIPRHEYIIVTPAYLKNSFHRLVNWKTQKGVWAKVLTLEEINATYTGRTQQIRIKKALKDYYDGIEDGLKYVLLGGDVSLVPSQPSYVEYNGSSFRSHTNVPCDWFYGCFGTMDWDTNANDTIADIRDNIDFNPDVIVSRLPVRNAEDVENITNRIIGYEGNPKLANWKDDILMAGSRISVDGDAEAKGDKMYADYISPYWENCIRTKFYDTGTDFPQGVDYDFTAPHLQTELAKGYSFINIDTHGGRNSWQMERGHAYEAYITKDARELNSKGNSIIVTTACLTNAFDNDSCLSKGFIQNPKSGIIAYYGSSREGWNTPNLTSLTSSIKYSCLLYKSLFRDYPHHRLGEAVVESKSNALSTYNSTHYTTDRWLLISLNLLGDPEMPVYIHRPLTFDSVRVSYSGGNLEINTGVDGSSICASNKQDNGEICYYRIEQNDSVFTYSLVPSGTRFCITKPGYIPYTFVLNQSGYIQNETFDGQNLIVSDEATIGSNVTTTKEEGPVTICSGKTTIITSNGVTIKNDFETAAGAELEIKPSN